MSENKSTKKKTTKKKTQKKVTTQAEKEEIPSPIGAKPPELSERIANETQPQVVETQEKTKSSQPGYNQSFQTVCGIPGLSAKQKSQIKAVMDQNWGKDKSAFIDSVVNISGLKEKRKVIEKALEKVL